MKTKQQELRRLTPEETRDIATAVCEADESDRSEAGRRAAERVASDVNSKFEDLRHARDYAYRLIDDVIADDNLKEKRDEAKQLRKDHQHGRACHEGCQPSARELSHQGGSGGTQEQAE
ncbi:MAG TPA: hypothetical protein VGC41_20270, partial [Kofleriaceae bacterium]